MENSFKIKSIKWFVPLELNHSSYIYSAAYHFCLDNNIKFKISFKNINSRGRFDTSNYKAAYSSHWYAKVTYLKILFENNTSKLLAFDLNDSSTFFSNEALVIADVVFKRCYQQKYINVLPIAFKNKIKPMGLPFMVKPNTLIFKYKISTLYFCFKFKALLKLDWLIFKRFNNWLKGSYVHWRNFINTRTVQDFFYFKNGALTNQIFYQKRLFPNENNEDTKKVHLQRVSIVRLLKTNFPNNFKGGLKLDEIVNNYYSDCISNIDGDPKLFLEEMRNSGICIYTKGLVDSPGWTLPEFLSQGKCIVAERMHNELPVPLEDNVHLIYFDSNEHLIEICKSLIFDKSEVNRLGKNARKYYETFVNPSIYLEGVIKNIEI